MEITIHTGTQNSANVIHVDWFDHNGFHQTTEIEINVQSQDKPRTLEFLLNGKLIAIDPSDDDTVQVVDAAFLKYAQHLPDCRMNETKWERINPPTCTCGFDEIASGYRSRNDMKQE